MKTCLLLGANSDIAKGILPYLEKEYTVVQWKRGGLVPMLKWDVCIITVGAVKPVGLWHSVDKWEWAECVNSNLTTPFMLLRAVWDLRQPDAKVIFFAGSNPQKIMDGYSAYNASKMALIKLVEQLDHETPDATFVAFGPGYVRTKIHKATLDANWPNERIARGDDGHSMEEIYNALRFCINAPKNMVGGTNICVSDVKKPKYFFIGDNYKLRRQELDPLELVKK